MVYIVQEQAGKNVTTASKFGKLEVLLPRDVQLTPNSNTAKLSRLLNNKLASFTDKDYLLLIGDPALIAMVAAIAAKNNNGKVKLLKWDNQDYLYYPVSFTIFQEV